MMWSAWWVWAVAAAALAALELAAPGWVFLGFALGAAAVALTLVVGGPLASVVAGSGAMALLVFAALSVAGWAALRLAFGARRGEAKTFERDVNED
jgi:membrane protein implicated in regulation of membrane protease activity